MPDCKIRDGVEPFRFATRAGISRHIPSENTFPQDRGELNHKAIAETSEKNSLQLKDQKQPGSTFEPGCENLSSLM